MAKPRPVGMRIPRPYASEQEFIRGDGLAIGRLGMILIGAPKRPPGITIRFEVMLQNGEPVFRGEGRVVAHRVHANGREGLEIRFTRLDSHSKTLVEQVLKLRRSGALTPLSATDPPPAKPEPAQQVDLASPPLEPEGDTQTAEEGEGQPEVPTSAGLAGEVEHARAHEVLDSSELSPIESEREASSPAVVEGRAEVEPEEVEELEPEEVEELEPEEVAAVEPEEVAEVEPEEVAEVEPEEVAEVEPEEVAEVEPEEVAEVEPEEVAEVEPEEVVEVEPEEVAEVEPEEVAEVEPEEVVEVEPEEVVEVEPEEVAAVAAVEEVETVVAPEVEPAEAESSETVMAVAAVEEAEDVEPEPDDEVLDEDPTPFAPPVMFSEKHAADIEPLSRPGVVSAAPEPIPASEDVVSALTKLRDRTASFDAPESPEAILERLRNRAKAL